MNMLMKILFIMVASVYEALEKGNKTDLIGVCLLIGIILSGGWMLRKLKGNPEVFVELY